MEAVDLVGGRYRLREVIGAGLWLADDQLLGRPVAIKEVGTPPGATDSLDMQLATMREARATARLDHPGVVHIFDVIWRPGTSWIVMEHVPSTSLHEAAPLSHREAARVGLGVLSALRAAHAAGVLHRDVNPHNVLLAEDGRVLLSNFGLSGAPLYPAPESARGALPAPAADLWSLGATLYAAVEGRSPFAGPPVRRGALTVVIGALLVADPAGRVTADRLEPMLRRASERVMGIFPVHPLSALPPASPQFTPAQFASPPPPSPLASPPSSPPSPPPSSRPSSPPSPPLSSRPSSPPSLRPRKRIARSTRVTMIVAGVLLVGTAGSALALDSTSSSPPSSARPSAGLASPACADPNAAGSVLISDQTEQRYALPSGWIWHRDPSGFQVALPQGWIRRTDGEAACFRDPRGGRSFQVLTNGPIVDDAVGHWAQAEQDALADGDLPGYQRIGMAALDLRNGGADWEYTWQPGPGARRHERRLLLSMGPSRAYVLDWSSNDPDWATSEPILSLIIASIS